RVVNKERNPDGFLMAVPFSFHSVLAEIKTVISHKNDYGIPMRAEGLQLASHGSDHFVHPGYQPIVIFYVFLEQFRCREKRFPSFSRQVFFGPEKIGETVPVFRSSGKRNRYFLVCIEIFESLLDRIRGGIAVQFVRRLKTNRETKGCFSFAREFVEKFPDDIPDAVCMMNDPPLAGVVCIGRLPFVGTLPEVESFLGRIVPDSVFPGKTNHIACL